MPHDAAVPPSVSPHWDRHAQPGPSVADRGRRRAGAVCSAAMFATRRKRFLDAMEPDSVAILLGAGLAVRSRDTHYRFRQDSDFHYLTGFDHPNAAAVLRTDGG